MALTSYTGTEIGLNGSSGTFDAWRTKTNDIIGDLSTVVVTVSSSATVANNTNGSQTTGNMDIDGYLSASDVVVWGTIRGGSNYTWATSATLVIDSAVTANGNIDVTGDVTATTFSGSGADLTSIPAGQLTGTVASARLTGTYAIDIGGNAATVTNGVYTTGDQTIGGAKTFSSTISGSIDGNAATATTATGATNIDIDATTSTDTTTYPVLVGAASTGNQVPFIDNADLSYNASTGALSAVSFIGDGSSLTGINTDLVDDTTPQLGGTLASNGNDIQMADNDSVIFGSGGAGSDSQIYWNGSALKVDVNGGNLHIEMDGGSNTDIVTITSGGANKFLFDASAGNLTVSGDITAFGTLSDIAVKENISLIENPLEKITKISGYTFNYKDNPDTRMTGVIAQEVQKILPEVVYRQGDKLAVRYNNMIGLLIEAIKELREEVRILKGEIQ